MIFAPHALAHPFVELEPREVEAMPIGPLSDRRQAREWALVLQSQAIAYVMVFVQPTMGDTELGVPPHPGGWVLRVALADYDRAVEAIDLYEIENENWPPPRTGDEPRHDASALVPTAFVAAMLFYLYVTGPAAAGSAWFTRGRADALLLWSEPWRMVTALTLHADAQHVIGNAISGSIFGAMVSRRLGGAGALLAILVSGILGNALNALHHLPDGHRSIGASTAIFGAVGILAALQTVLSWGKHRQGRPFGLVDMVAPVIGGLALLGALGAGKGNTDLWAHGFGFLSGIGVGLVAGLALRGRKSAPSKWVQGASLAAAAALVAGAWALALF